MSWSLFGSAMTPMDPAMKEKNEILRAMDLILKAYKTRVAAEAKLRNLIAQDTVTQLCLACNTVEQGDVTQSTKDEKTSISIGDSKTKPLSGGDTAIASAAGVASGSALTDDSAKVVIATSASPMKSRVFQIKDLVHVYWNDSIHWQEGRLVGMKKQLNGLMEYTVASGDETKFVSEKELRFPESNKDGIRGQVTPKHDFVTNDEIQEAYIDLLVAHFALRRLRPIMARLISLVGPKLAPKQSLWIRDDHKSDLWTRHDIVHVTCAPTACRMLVRHAESTRALAILWAVTEHNVAFYVPSFESVIGNTTQDMEMLQAIHTIVASSPLDGSAISIEH